MKSNYTVLLILLLLVGCESRDIKPKGTGTAYFPLKTGAFWVYDITEITITQLGGQTSSTYELKIQISDSIVSSGQVTYLLQRFKRSDSSQPWISIETWSAKKDEFRGILQEGNTAFVKLAFPLVEGKSWNANALNNLGGTDKCSDGTFQCENYVATDLWKRFEGPNVNFDETITIVENNDNDPIVMQDIRKSVYAKSIGLVYRETSILQYCTVGDCIGKQIVQNGNVLKQTVKDYGGL